VKDVSQEKEVKCSKNNPNHKPNVPLVTEEQPYFAPYMGQDGTIYFFLLCHFSCLDDVLSSVQDVTGYLTVKRHK
jgi:hypothetical protein